LVGKKTERINSSRLRFSCNDTATVIICSGIIAANVSAAISSICIIAADIPTAILKIILLPLRCWWQFHLFALLPPADQRPFENYFIAANIPTAI